MSGIDPMGGEPGVKPGLRKIIQEFRLITFRVRRSVIQMIALPLIKIRDRILLSDSSSYSRVCIPVSHNSADHEIPFFVLGHPRSGTTLLREIINKHPNLFIPPENGSFRRMIGSFGSCRTSEWDVVVDTMLYKFSQGYEFNHWKTDMTSVKRKLLELDVTQRNMTSIFNALYREYGEQHAEGTARWGDKSTPGHYYYLSKLKAVFPNAKYIHIVRDGRDSAASCVRTGFYDGSPEKAAYAWSDNVRMCRMFGEELSDENFYSLKYENLVNEPEVEIRKICNFLNEEYFPQMLSANDSKSDVSPDVEMLEHHANVVKPISSASIGKWKTQISSESKDRLNRILKKELQLYGYQVHG